MNPISANELHKKRVKLRMRVMIAVIALGVCISLCVVGVKWSDGAFKDSALDMYLGMGLGMSLMAAVVWLRCHWILRDNCRIARDRLCQKDERNRSVSSTAFHIASAVLLTALLIVGIVSSFMDTRLSTVLFSLFGLFFAAYSAAYWICQKKM